MKKLFLDFCNKNGLRVEDVGSGVLYAYISNQYFTDDPEDVIAFIEYNDRKQCVCVETCVDCYYNALNKKNSYIYKLVFQKAHHIPLNIHLQIKCHI